MPGAALGEYLQQLPNRMAELRLVLAGVVSLPYMDADDRQQALRQWQSEAGIEERVEAATPQMMMLMGIGVRHE